MNEGLLKRIRVFLSRFASDYTWGFIIVISISAISGIFSIHYINSLESEFSQIFEYDISGRNNILYANSMILRIDGGVKDLLIYKDGANREETLATLRSNITVITNLLQSTKYRFVKEKERKIYLQSRHDLDDFLTIINDKIDNPAGMDIDDEFMEKLKNGKDAILADFSLLNVMKRNSITSVFGNIKLQLGTSLAFTILLLLGTVGIRLVMYLNRKEKRNHP